jgi:hypothetical protein
MRTGGPPGYRQQPPDRKRCGDERDQVARGREDRGAKRYGDALRNQEESIRLQQTRLRRVRLVLGFATIAVILAVGMLVLLVPRIAARLG